MKPIRARRTQPVKTSRKKLEVPEVLLTLSRSPVVKGWHAERLGKLARSFAPARLGIPSSAFSRPWSYVTSAGRSSSVPGNRDSAERAEYQGKLTWEPKGRELQVCRRMHRQKRLRELSRTPALTRGPCPP